ncbi:MAG: Cl-channel voltage-gated family protein [uncultured Thiotrichaceae bacterium]|uniref:Cl-channel voltage-gated family protein n=1 Tax=uncultured Thiotrichaceae bacterium TaxID=298394 RepID=A0A6S6SDZ7_9GAMM|nr:MAG: Cl-channel voltage-gated family protein [uncultured Thiotrichaceae bacterium]
MFISLLQARGLDHASSPVMQRLRMIGAASVMNRSFVLCKNELPIDLAKNLLNKEVQWLVITDTENKPQEMVRTLDLQGFIETHPDVETIILSEIPGHRLQLTALSVRASLQEGLDQLNSQGAEALYLHREGRINIYGVITRAQVEKNYL